MSDAYSTTSVLVPKCFPSNTGFDRMHKWEWKGRYTKECNRCGMKINIEVPEEIKKCQDLPL